MAADWYSAQQAILNLLQTDSRLSKVQVFDGAVPEGTAIPLLASGGVAPHIAVVFGGTVNRKGKGSEGIVGAAYDSVTGQFVVHSICGVPGDARQLAQIVTNVVVGFEPPNCSEVVPAFFAGVMQFGAQNAPARFGADQAFELLVNSTN